MQQRRRGEAALIARAVLRGVVLGALVGVLCGAASAGFLSALDWATNTRERYGWLLWLLPLAGAGIAWVYERYGKAVAAGNNLLLARLFDARPAPIPLRLVPLILGTTVATHLFGGSAGREGVAVQVGGTLAGAVCRVLRLGRHEARDLLRAGISGGFGAIFGTPLAGAVFGLEVTTLGQMRYEAIVPCFVAAVVGDQTCRALGITHYAYRVAVLPFQSGTQTSLLLSAGDWVRIVGAGILFAGAAWLFVELTELVAHTAKARIASPLLRPVVGGVVVIALTYAVGSREYLGLSLPLIAASFEPGKVVLWAWALKLVFTAVTLGTGFKGGEVTPLFCIGATLGAAFAQITHQPSDFYAALGFVAVFAGAANTPLACTLLGVELFGGAMGLPIFAVCLLSYLLTGHRGIYGAQQIGVAKARGLRRVGRLADVRGKRGTRR